MDTTTMKTIGILETGLPPEHLEGEHRSYINMMMNLVNSASNQPAFNYKGYHVINNELPETAEECDGWLITGSKYGVYDELPWIEPLKTLVQAIYQAEIPLVGICFGHQVMVEALGGKVMKSDKGWGLGLQTYKLDKQPDGTAADQETLTLNAIHQDQVVSVPPDAEVFASSEFCQYAGLRYGRKAFSLQPHPEFSIAYEQALIKYRRGSVFPEGVSDEALAGLKGHDKVADALQVASWMHHFFMRQL